MLVKFNEFWMLLPLFPFHFFLNQNAIVAAFTKSNSDHKVDRHRDVG